MQIASKMQNSLLASARMPFDDIKSYEKIDVNDE